MTTLLEKAIAQMASLPAKEQDAIAQIVLDEIADEKLWDEKFARHPEVLEKLGDEALAEYEAGETVPLDDVLKELDETIARSVKRGAA